MGGFLGKAAFSADTYQIRTANDESEPDLGMAFRLEYSITIGNIMKVTRNDMMIY